MKEQKKYRGQDLTKMEISKEIASKYGNRLAKIDGITFDSIREAAYYQFLKKELAAGRILKFQRQVPFPIILGNKRRVYFADFVVYYKNSTFKVIDVKGFRTDVYKAKKRAVKKCYGITIIEK